MSVNSRTRLLSIGEFSAATQLSPKALRLYDEQRILQPARTDASSGYRYYQTGQVPLGRLIRTLRDMNLPLADVARVVQMDRQNAEQVLNQFAAEIDRRYARNKRVMQTALLLLRDSCPSERLTIEERNRPGMTVVVWPVLTDRFHFYERLRAARDAAERPLARAQLRALQVLYCRLLDPLQEEEVQLELLIPVEPPVPLAEDITLRQVMQAPCAVIDVSASTGGPDFSAPVDALFDWFDRRGYQAIDTPWLARTFQEEDVRTEVLWAYHPHLHPGS